LIFNLIYNEADTEGNQLEPTLTQHFSPALTAYLPEEFREKIKSRDLQPFMVGTLGRLCPLYFGGDRVMVDLYLSWGAGLSGPLWQLAGADSVLAGFPVGAEFTAAGAQAA
jgi:hypothetical protein